MNPNLEEIWVYLSTSPLLGLTLTLLAYQAAFWIYKRVGFHPLANPVLLSVAILASLLLATGTPYQAYFDGAQFVHFLLGPATVALAIPLYAQWPRLKAMAGPLMIALVAGSLTAVLVISAGIIGAVFGRGVMRRLHVSDHAVHGFAIGIASHGIGTARAFQVSEQAGAFAALAMGLNGLITAVSLPWLMPWVERLFAG